MWTGDALKKANRFHQAANSSSLTLMMVSATVKHLISKSSRAIHPRRLLWEQHWHPKREVPALYFCWNSHEYEELLFSRACPLSSLPARGCVLKGVSAAFNGFPGLQWNPLHIKKVWIGYQGHATAASSAKTLLLERIHVPVFCLWPVYLSHVHADTSGLVCAVKAARLATCPTFICSLHACTSTRIGK